MKSNDIKLAFPIKSNTTAHMTNHHKHMVVNRGEEHLHLGAIHISRLKPLAALYNIYYNSIKSVTIIVVTDASISC